MNVHEYQAKEILASYGVKIPKGDVAETSDQAVEIAKNLNCSTRGYVVKAQIHAGGRGKGGGVKLAHSIDEVEKLAHSILGMNLVTHQTGSEGKLVRKILINEASTIEKELYLGMVVDRENSAVVMMASEEGGVEIEKVAAETPGKILKEIIDPAIGLQDFQARQLAFKLNLPKDLIRSATKLMKNLYDAFLGSDCSLMELNPLAIVKTEAGSELLAIDAKMNFDDNALFRQKNISELRDIDEEDQRELEANKSGLSYISLDGNIGCMVNGAGLAMATMDAIKLHGGEPANFLDVGGSASTEAVSHAFKLILSDPKVKAVLVNIFGGIMKCDIIANGIIEAVKQIELNVPLVVRLEGTNVELGRKILAESGLELITAESLADAAERVVAV